MNNCTCLVRKFSRSKIEVTRKYGKWQLWVKRVTLRKNKLKKGNICNKLKGRKNGDFLKFQNMQEVCALFKFRLWMLIFLTLKTNAWALSFVQFKVCFYLKFKNGAWHSSKYWCITHIFVTKTLKREVKKFLLFAKPFTLLSRPKF